MYVSLHSGRCTPVWVSTKEILACFQEKHNYAQVLMLISIGDVPLSVPAHIVLTPKALYAKQGNGWLLLHSLC